MAVIRTMKVYGLKGIAMSILFVLLVAIFIAGCSVTPPQQQAESKPSPSPSPKNKEDDPLTKATEEEGSDQEDEDVTVRPQVRQVALDYLKATQPTAKAEGVNLFAYSGNIYIATIDATVNGQPRTFTFIVRMFIKDSGEKYWKAEPMTQGFGQVLSGYTYERYKKLKNKYNTLEQERDELQSEKEERDNTDDTSDSSDSYDES